MIRTLLLTAFTGTVFAETLPVNPAAEGKGKALVQAPVSARGAKGADVVAPAGLSPWRISAGYVWRQLGSLHFDTAARARSYPIPAFDTSDPGPAGTATSAGGHNYKDGYVLSDSSGPGSSETWNWGYQSAGQLAGSDLAFRGTANLYSQTSHIMAHPGWDSDVAGGGPILSAEWSGIEFKPGLRLGAELSVSLIEADEGRSLNTLRVEHQVVSAQITDHYTVDPFAVPGAPYTGSFSGPGPIVPASPTSRMITGLGSLSTTAYYDEVDEHLGLTLTTVSIGPTVSFERGRLTSTGGVGLALNIASWNADKTDSLYRSSPSGTALIARWHDHQGGSDVLPGLYLQAAVAYSLNDHWAVQAFGRYDWSEALAGHVGGSSFNLGLSGWSLGAGVVYRF